LPRTSSSVRATGRSDSLAAVGTSIEQIEIKIAYLEQANAELSDVVYQQRQELESLRAQLSELLRRLDAAQAPTTDSLEGEKPPHY
jgi:uncharacterized coiled-coil protein SlyX